MCGVCEKRVVVIFFIFFGSVSIREIVFRNVFLPTTPENAEGSADKQHTPATRRFIADAQ